jgi:N-acylglucosamine-6-phosphate 2-epimerase
MNVRRTQSLLNAEQMKAVIEKLRGGLIVSCQAPAGSPLDDAEIIAAFALTAEQQGAVGVRLNGAGHVVAARRRVTVPVIGLEKVVTPESEVYITPTFEVARRVAAGGAHVVALDATARPRPGGENVAELIRRVREGLRLPVMADVDGFDAGLRAADDGADIVATTLCGYTAETKGERLPAFDLLARLAARLRVPVVCEGGVSSPEEVRRAFECGAFAVVVGTAITGVGQLARKFVEAAPRVLPAADLR